MPRFLQPSLSGGELSPGLQARTDAIRYAISLKTAINVITKPTGGAAKRPGLIFRGEVKDSSKRVRLVPFIYSTEVNYLIEMGDSYLRFWVNGALLRDGSNNIVEVASPYTEAQIGDVRFTQSADVLYLTHPHHAPRELRRLTSNSFELRAFEFRRGPFRPFNPDEAHIMAVSGTTGIVTVTSNKDTFSANDVGALIYMEEKELRSIKPWVAGERSPTPGVLRRSDQKVYRCVGVPSTAGGAGTPYYLCGSVRPTHEVGRAFDGPQDKKNDGVNDYWTGVEWEFLHNTFGLLQITGYTNAKSVTARVVERVPDSLVGQAETPLQDCDHTGDGVAKQFDITGATSLNVLDYRVLIDGVAIQSNPDYPGGGGVGGGGGGSGPGPRPGLPPNYTPIQ